jgi:hypothetical protein|tara:strand:+ start:61 stop:609 length:549 start_codon:yes stop_codon:yes gene_type:complete
MVPLIIAGMAAARLVTPIIAKKLLREGLAKAAPKAAKVSSSNPITSMNQLPKNLIKPATPSKPPVTTGRNSVVKRKELMARTKKNREQIKNAKEEARSPSSSVVQKKPMSVLEKAKQEMKISDDFARKLRGAEQVRGPLNKVPLGKKGMQIPGKGETVKRKAGGKVVKTNMSGDGLVRGCYD